MNTATPVSVEEYLAYTGKPNCEYIHGVMRPKPLGTGKHGKTQVEISLLLRKLGYEVAAELTVKISDDLCLIPDVAADIRLPDRYPISPVLLCVEVLSPEDRVKTTLKKCELYHEWGVPHCWVVDPEKERAWEYHRGASLVETSILHAGEIAVSLSDIFAEGK